MHRGEAVPYGKRLGMSRETVRLTEKNSLAKFQAILVREA